MSIVLLYAIALILSKNSISLILTSILYHQNDLLRRLRTVVQTLREEDDLEHDEYPGLDGLARILATKKYLEHKDKEIRLYTVLACVEIFYVVS
jgi:hypothetical protein